VEIQHQALRIAMENFEIVATIGEGSFAKVFKARRKCDLKFYAIKIARLNKMKREEVQQVFNEVRLLASIHHPNIVRFYECFQVGIEEVCLVLEYCCNGDLAQEIEKRRQARAFFEERIIWMYMVQLFKAIAVLHSHFIAHRDIKTANVFLGESQMLKLGDLNISKRLKNNLFLKTQTGTPYYMSPEVWDNKLYDCSSDIWALGVVLYEMCCLCKPFTAKSFDMLKKKVKNGIYFPIEQIQPKYSEALSSVVSLLLQVDPDQRPSADELLQCSEIQQNAIALFHSEFEMEECMEILDTIRVPENLEMLETLKHCLPKSQYPEGNDTIKIMKSNFESMDSFHNEVIEHARQPSASRRKSTKEVLFALKGGDSAREDALFPQDRQDDLLPPLIYDKTKVAVPKLYFNSEPKVYQSSTKTSQRHEKGQNEGECNEAEVAVQRIHSDYVQSKSELLDIEPLNMSYKTARNLPQKAPKDVFLCAKGSVANSVSSARKMVHTYKKAFDREKKPSATPTLSYSEEYITEDYGFCSPVVTCPKNMKGGKTNSGAKRTTEESTEHSKESNKLFHPSERRWPLSSKHSILKPNSISSARSKSARIAHGQSSFCEPKTPKLRINQSMVSI